MLHFKLPDLGEGLQEAQLVEWMVKPGDHLKTDDLMVVVETAKAIVELPAPEDVVIGKLCVKEGDVVHIGEVLVEFVVEGSNEQDAGTVVGELKESDSGSQMIMHDEILEADVLEMPLSLKPMGEQLNSRPYDVSQSNKNLNGYIAPSVIGFANQLGVDLSVVGVEPGRVVDMAFVSSLHEQNLAAQSKSHSRDLDQGANDSRPNTHAIDLAHGIPLKGAKRSMALAMQTSHESIPAVTLFEDVDIHDWGPKSDFTVRLLHSMVTAAKDVPILNAWFDGAKIEIELKRDINIGLAVNTDDGLYVPVIKQAQNLKVRELRSCVNRFREQVMEHSIKPADMMGATITLSNFGTLAGRYATPIIVPPQVAIIGAGVVRDQVVAKNGKAEVRRILPLSISFDHRAATGADAASFLAVMMRELRQPSVSK